MVTSLVKMSGFAEGHPTYPQKNDSFWQIYIPTCIATNIDTSLSLSSECLWTQRIDNFSNPSMRPAMSPDSELDTVPSGFLWHHSLLLLFTWTVKGKWRHALFTWNHVAIPLGEKDGASGRKLRKGTVSLSDFRVKFIFDADIAGGCGYREQLGTHFSYAYQSWCYRGGRHLSS